MRSSSYCFGPLASSYPVATLRLFELFALTEICRIWKPTFLRPLFSPPSSTPLDGLAINLSELIRLDRELAGILPFRSVWTSLSVAVNAPTPPLSAFALFVDYLDELNWLWKLISRCWKSLFFLELFWQGWIWPGWPICCWNCLRFSGLILIAFGMVGWSAAWVAEGLPGCKGWIEKLEGMTGVIWECWCP